MLAVESAQPSVIEGIVVKTAEPFPARIVGPNPFLEPLLYPFLFLSVCFRGLGVDDGILFFVKIIDGWRLEIECILDEIETGVSVRAPICRVARRLLHLPISFYIPSAKGMDVTNLNAR